MNCLAPSPPALAATNARDNPRAPIRSDLANARQPGAPVFWLHRGRGLEIFKHVNIPPKQSNCRRRPRALKLVKNGNVTAGADLEQTATAAGRDEDCAVTICCEPAQHRTRSSGDRDASREFEIPNHS